MSKPHELRFPEKEMPVKSMPPHPFTGISPLGLCRFTWKDESGEEHLCAANDWEHEDGVAVADANS